MYCSFGHIVTDRHFFVGRTAFLLQPWYAAEDILEYHSEDDTHIVQPGIQGRNILMRLQEIVHCLIVHCLQQKQEK